MEGLIIYIVGALIILVLAAALVPVGLTSIHNANTTGWTSSETAIFGIFGVIVLVGVLVGIVYMALKKGK
jgi:hypothetical protein